jgi:hypothetical protein
VSVRALALCCAAAALAAAAPARAQFEGREAPQVPPTDQAPTILEEARIDERLGNPVPLDLASLTGEAATGEAAAHLTLLFLVLIAGAR